VEEVREVASQQGEPPRSYGRQGKQRAGGKKRRGSRLRQIMLWRRGRDGRGRRREWQGIVFRERTAPTREDLAKRSSESARKGAETKRRNAAARAASGETQRRKKPASTTESCQTKSKDSLEQQNEGPKSSNKGGGKTLGGLK